MGNYISCTLLGPMGRQSRCTKVILPAGEVRHFYEPVKAAELMLEHCPNHFLVDTKSLHIGRRFSALGADEELEMASVYATFAMKRVNSLVTAADMGALFLTAAANSKRGPLGSVRILPDCMEAMRAAHEPAQSNDGSAGSLPTLKLDDIEEFLAQEFKRRLSMCRSKKPLLETIVEEAAYSR